MDSILDHIVQPHPQTALIPTKCQQERKWWHTATIYQLYPASFSDSNGDGIGDIPGIISKVPYIASLGIDAVWLSACYRSSGVDMGYDVKNYRDIDPQYGTVQDVERLIAELAKHGIKLIMDLVVNHTSDEHPWFNESRSSLSNPKRDWYFWQKGLIVNGQRLPPNNWGSAFCGSAWTYDELTDEYYLRIFSPQQPDLNWENPAVRKAVYGDMRFWLEKGVAGFRMDVINLIAKTPGLPDAKIVDPASFEQSAYYLFSDIPPAHSYLQEMKREALDPFGSDTMTVGEVIVTESPATIRSYTEPGRKELNMAYNYDIFGMDCGPTGKLSKRDWTASEFRANFKDLIVKWQTTLSYSSGGWNTIWLESHDTARSVTRFGDGKPENRFKVAKMLALLTSTLGGTLFVYQGQELGMKNLDSSIPLEEYPDVELKRTLADIRSTRAKEQRIPESDVDMADVAIEARIKARDHARMPLPWKKASEAEPFAGFSEMEKGMKTWSPMNTDSAVCNIAQQDDDEASVLNFWRHRLKLRKKYAETLVFGDFEVVKGSLGEGEVFAYWRKPLVSETEKVKGVGGDGMRDILVVLNLTGKEGVRFKMPPLAGGKYFVLEVTSIGVERGDVVDGDGQIVLGAYEGSVFGF